MAYKVRAELIESGASGRKNGRTAERILEDIEVEVEDQAEGKEVLDGIAEHLEDAGFDVEDEGEN